MIVQWLISSYNTAKTYATWNTSDKWASITLSNWNKTMSNSSEWKVRSTIWKSSGKWYWETIPSVATASVIWIATSSANLAKFPWNDAFSWWNYSAATWYFYNGSLSWTEATYTAWDVIWMALDMDLGTLNWYKNGTLTWTWITWLTWTVYASDWWWATSSTTTTNFWETTFSYSPPSWFNSWLYN